MGDTGSGGWDFGFDGILGLMGFWDVGRGRSSPVPLNVTAGGHGRALSPKRGGSHTHTHARPLPEQFFLQESAQGMDR